MTNLFNYHSKIEVTLNDLNHNIEAKKGSQSAKAYLVQLAMSPTVLVGLANDAWPFFSTQANICYRAPRAKGF